MTPKQKLQKDRAYFKFVLTGLIKPIQYSSLTEYELEEWATILNIRDELLQKFNSNSKMLGLNVPEHKCYKHKCKNKVRYFCEINEEKFYFCEKHSKQYDLKNYELERL